MRHIFRADRGRVNHAATVAAYVFLATIAAPVSGVSAATLKILHSFPYCSADSCADGSGPYGNLVRDSAGNLYGTTNDGGTNAQGTVFQLRPHKHGGWSYKTIYNFCAEADCEDGANPQATLIIDKNGTLYGTTQAPEAGKVFRLTPNKSDWELVPIHDFCGQEEGEDCKGGANPAGGLTYAGAATGVPYDGVSPLYGAAMEGGEGGAGVIYQLKPPIKDKENWRVSELYIFCVSGGAKPASHRTMSAPRISLPSGCAEGKMPSGRLTIDAAGNLFGTTYYGGSDAILAGGGGVVFELSRTPDKTWSEVVLHQFCQASGCSDGQNPYGGLSMDGAGKLFGVTLRGGKKCKDHDPCGIAFQIAPNGKQSSFAALHNFCSAPHCADGAGPQGELAMDSSGRLFGATLLGGVDKRGSIFRLQGNILKTLYSFCTKKDCADGQLPAGVIADGAGNLFGVTTAGGDMNGGTVFELTP